MIRAIVFDFDGVIVDSNYLKHEAWFKLFSKKDGIPLETVENALSQIEETRFDILKEIFIKAGKPADVIENLVDIFAERYDQIVQKEVLERGFFPETKKILKELSDKYDLYINSSTPELALKQSVFSLGIDGLFIGVFGRPATKEDNLKRILCENHLSPAEVLVVGDGEADRRSADFLNCRFIGIANNYNNWKSDNFLLISGINELKTILIKF